LEAIETKDIKPFENKPGEGDVVIGCLTDTDVQKLFTLRRLLGEEAAELVREYEHTEVDERAVKRQNRQHDRANCPACRMRPQLALINQQMEAVDALCWASLWAELTLAQATALEEAGGTIGLAEGWQITGSRPSPRGVSIFELLGSPGIPPR
jgi:hypothetical protein